MTDIPVWYKQTEIGIIPNDWDALSISSLWELLNKTLNPQEFPLKTFYEYSMPAFDNWKKPNVSLWKSMLSSRIVINGNVLLYNKLNVKQKRIWLVNAWINSLCSWEFLPFISHWTQLNYIEHVLKQDSITSFFVSISKWTSNSQKRISPSDFLEFKIPVPTEKKEQQAIATTLSDMDELISSLDEVIEKKKNIKKWAMQKLLTPKEWWIKTTLGEEWIFVAWNGFPVKYQWVNRWKYPFYKVSDFNNNSLFVMDVANNYVSEEVVKILHCNIIPQWAILFAKIWAAIFLERKKLTTRNCCIDNNMQAFLPNQNNNEIFFLYLFKKICLWEYAWTSALPALSSKVLKNISITIPSTIEEQQKIATILSDMDKEIEALEEKKAKYEQIKQWAMQKLLTGKIRLV